MIIIGTIFCLEFREAVEAGIQPGTITMANMRKTDGWQFHPHPADARKVLIAYEPLRDKYKQLIIARYGDPYQYHAATSFKHLLNTNPPVALRGKRAEAEAFYRAYILPTGDMLSADHANAYIKAAEWLHLINYLTGPEGKPLRHPLALQSAKAFWPLVCKLIEAEKIALPSCYGRLVAKLNEFQLSPSGERGGVNYECIIPLGKFGNKNSEKISQESTDWLVAQYGLGTMQLSSLHEQYNAEALRRNWPPVKSEQAIYRILELPENKHVWYIARYGEKSYRKIYGYSVHRDLPSHRDALWFSDGTKLNFYYQDEEGRMRADMNIYLVIDAYSEVILGYAVGETEDYALQYATFKKAIQYAGAKPYELRYDNQSGHKKIGDFLDRLAHINFPCQPYRPTSKPVESLIGRMQMRYMRRHWNFTGQNITAKKRDSRQDIDFIRAHKSELPTLEQAVATVACDIADWNAAKHPRMAISRQQAYQTSINPDHHAIDILDMVDMFWLEKRGRNGRGLVYHNNGLALGIKDKEYLYEALTIKDGRPFPDMHLRQQLIDQEFVVKYDPCDLSHIRIYRDHPTGGLQYISSLEPVVRVPLAIADYSDSSYRDIRDLLQLGRDEVKATKRKRAALEERTGIYKDDIVYNDQQEYYKQVSNVVEGEDDERELVDVNRKGNGPVDNWARM